MFGSKIKKRASIAVEVTFAILLSLGVLFLVLGMFGDNLNDMMNHGGLPNVFNETAAKTKVTDWNIDPTNNKITAPEAQMAGYEAVLSDYNKKAQDNIESYYEESQSSSLNDEDTKNLAMWLAIFANSSTTGSGKPLLEDTYFKNSNTSYYDFGYSKKINLDNLDVYKLTTTNTSDPTTYNWGNYLNHKNENAKSGIEEGTSAKNRVSNIRDENGIIDTFSK